MEFKDLIKNIREQYGLTQDELAQRIYITRQAISKWEIGKGLPSLESLKIISKEFNITMEELLGVVENQNTKRWIPLAKRSLFRFIMSSIKLIVAIIVWIIGIYLGLDSDQETARITTIILISVICCLMFILNLIVLIHSLFPLKKTLLYYTSTEIKIETNKGSIIIPFEKLRGISYSTIGTSDVGTLTIDTTERFYKLYSVDEVNKVKTILDEVRILKKI